MPPRDQAGEAEILSVCAALLLSSLLLVAIQPGVHAQSEYAIEKIFYGSGWSVDSVTGVRRQTAILNLTQEQVETFPGGGAFEAFSQIFVEFSTPADSTGPSDGPGLRIRFSYHVSARCLQLSESVCPLGANTTAISQDVMDLQVRRILEYRDTDGNQKYDPGEPAVQEIPLSQPQAPFVATRPLTRNGSDMELPYTWNVSSDNYNITLGALFAGDPLLDELYSFRIAVGNGAPLNLTIDSFLFLRPTTYKGIPLTPSEVKLDISMSDIRYAANDTELALELTFQSAQYRIGLNATGVSETLSMSSAAAEAFFAWSSNATVDGRLISVGSTTRATNDSARTIYLSYGRGARIEHDPVLGLALKPSGVSQPPPETGNLQTTALWFLILAPISLAIGVASFVLFRRRRRP